MLNGSDSLLTFPATRQKNQWSRKTRRFSRAASMWLDIHWDLVNNCRSVRRFIFYRSSRRCTTRLLTVCMQRLQPMTSRYYVIVSTACSIVITSLSLFLFSINFVGLYTYNGIGHRNVSQGLATPADTPHVMNNILMNSIIWGFSRIYPLYVLYPFLWYINIDQCDCLSAFLVCIRLSAATSLIDLDYFGIVEAYALTSTYIFL